MMRAPRYNDLKAIEGHKNYYRNSISKKITYQRRGVRIATKVVQITKAKEYVERELARRQGQPITDVRRRLRGVSNPFIRDAWELMFEQNKERWTKSTRATYNKSWNIGLSGFWDDKFAADLTAENLSLYRTWYLENHPTRQFEKTLIHFQVLLKFMLKAKMIGHLPDLTVLADLDAQIDKTAKREKVGRRLTESELQAIESAAANYVNTRHAGTTTEHKQVLGLRAQLGVALGAWCGMRKMEGMSLAWETVHLDKALMSVWSTKNDRWRDIPIVPRLEELFRRQYELTGHTPWVFPMPTDPARHISGQVFDSVWVKVKRDAKIQGRLRYHDLRHTFASITADLGWPYKVACEILDMSLQIYDRIYAKASFEKKSEMMLSAFGGGK